MVRPAILALVALLMCSSSGSAEDVFAQPLWQVGGLVRQVGELPQIAYGGNVLVITAADGVHAVDARTGRGLWRYADAGGPVVGGLVVGGHVVYGGMLSGGTSGLFKQSLVALDLATGALLWKRDNDGGRLDADANGVVAAATGVSHCTTPTDTDAGFYKRLETTDAPFSSSIASLRSASGPAHSSTESSSRSIEPMEGSKARLVGSASSYRSDPNSQLAKATFQAISICGAATQNC